MCMMLPYAVSKPFQTLGKIYWRSKKEKIENENETRDFASAILQECRIHLVVQEAQSEETIEF